MNQHTGEFPKISIITVVFNGEKTIENTIQSVLSQSYLNIDFIIIDGGSKDRTLEIINKYDEQITICISEPDSGIYDAMNKGIELVRDEESFILFLNSDDYLENPNSILDFASQMKDKSFYYGRITFDDGLNKIKIGDPITISSLPYGMIHHQATVIKKSLFTKLGHFDLSYRILADYDFAVKVFVNSYPETQFIDQTLSTMRMGGISNTQVDLMLREKVDIIRKYFSGFKMYTALFKIYYIAKARIYISRLLRRYDLLTYWRRINFS